ncbi:hypothetical protein E4U23_007145 [Claviceps purpurea]|nr:hypothetical protein E4U23_007145 [Claviceps purpurea]
MPQYGKKGEAFILPRLLPWRHDVVIPQSQIRWLLDQPDSVVSAFEAHQRALFYGYTFLDHGNAKESFSNRVIHRFAARHTRSMIPGLGEEVAFSMNKALGDVGSEWTTVNLWDFWMRVVPIPTSMLIAGSKTCRDERLNKSIVDFVGAAIRTQLTLRLVPTVLQPLIGRLVTIPNRRHWKSMCDVVMPTIKERLHSMTKQAEGCPGFEAYVPPEDYITWVIRLIIAENRTGELDPIKVSKRLLPIAFASIHTTVLTCHSLMLDLLSTDPEHLLLDTLREEIEAHRPASGMWNKEALRSLVKVDSAIRESQRLNPLSSAIVTREIVDAGGLHHPDLGWTLAKGTSVMVYNEGIQRDEDAFDDALLYKPFRYTSMQETQDRDALGGGRKTLGQYTMTATSEQHLPFGHGRHACPGRFFVSYEIKMFLAHLLTNYDIKMLDKRPLTTYVGLNPIPPIGTCIEIRKRHT